MLKYVVEHIVRLPDEELPQATLEDIAIAQAWYASPEAGGAPDWCASIPDRVAAWLASPEPENADAYTEGRRQQPLIRRLIDLAKAHPENLKASEWAVLRSCLALAQSSRRDFEKLIGILTPILRSNVAKNTPAPSPELPQGDRLVRMIRGQDIRKSRPRKIRYFAGFDLPAFGPVLSITGDVKVVDNVPEESTLVIEKGGCTVGGYVFGRIAASAYCEVRDNISGVVIAREGNIRGRDAVSGAFIVAKWGAVSLRGAQSPKLVFGGSALRIFGDARAGSYASPYIEVSGEAIGGSWSASIRIQANCFRQTHTQTMDIALQRDISYEDYGGLIAPEANRMLHRLARIRRSEGNYGVMMRLAREECEHYASSAVLYLLGGENLRANIDAVEAKRRRLAFLDRVIAGLEATTQSAEDELRSAGQRAADDDDSSHSLDVSGLENIEEELGQIEAEGSVGDELSQEGQALVTMAKQAKSGRKRRRLPPAELFRLREKKAHWINERNELSEELKTNEAELATLAGRASVLENSNGEKNRVQLFTQLLKLARSRPETDPLHQRSKSTFVLVLLRAIDARRKRVQNYTKLIENTQTESNAVVETLENEHHIRAKLDATNDDIEPEAVGKFEGGITICTDRFLLEESDVPQGHIVPTRDSGDTPIRYIRTASGIIET